MGAPRVLLVRGYIDLYVLSNTILTCLVFNQRKMILNIRNSNQTIRAYTNRGTRIPTWWMIYLFFFKVWLNADLLVKILLFSDVCKKNRVTMYTRVVNCINVHVNEEELIKLKEVKSELYLMSRNNNDNNNNKNCILLNNLSISKQDWLH